MHIEPGLLAPAKLLFANLAATGLLAAHALPWLKRPTLWLRTAIAALFFTACMQAFHLKVGPSELHFVGAMPIYLLCGLLPTLFGFALGLLLQGLVFEPQDLVHLAVNALSLIVPLLVTHHTLGQRLRTFSVANILKLDGLYYAGVTLMVGFWLANGQTATALSPWAGFAAFAASYLAIVAVEPLLTWAMVRGVQRLSRRAQPEFADTASAPHRFVDTCFDERITQAACA